MEQVSISPIIPILNFVALIVMVFGTGFFFYALWRIMKSAKEIEKVVKTIEKKLK